MSNPQYIEAVKDSFIHKPLRTVLLIDDEFPTYSNLCKGETSYAQKERAQSLYQGFRNRQMLCDVENTVEQVNIDCLRKSDLVILDYHLTRDSTDGSQAIRLLRLLATSPHFNTVVVYTAAPDQDEVWLDVIASLSGGWSAVTASLEGEPKQHWENLNDTDRMPDATREAVMQYARRGNLRDINKVVLQAAQNELQELGVPVGNSSKIVEYSIAKQLADRAGEYAAQPSGHAVGDFTNGRRWLQVGNAFIVIMEKVQEPNDASETTAIMSALDEALLEWRPNVIQILISDIQNALELEGFAGNDTLLRKPDMQAALVFNLLKEIGPIDLSKELNIRVPVMNLVDKVVDSIRRRLSTNVDLLTRFEDAVIGDLKTLGWTAENWPTKTKLLAAAIQLARTTDTKGPELMFRLNHFLSTERFRPSHLTTGTVFIDQEADEYFVIASPACDLVAGQGNNMQHWTTEIQPARPFVAIRLHPESMDKALNVASQANHIFVSAADEAKAFKVISGNGNQPSYEVMFAQDDGRVRSEDGRIVFDGVRVVVGESKSEAVAAVPAGEARSTRAAGENQNEPVHDQREEPTTSDAPPVPTAASTSPQEEASLRSYTFEVVDQLKGVNSTHLLQLVGQHLSRVGLDFVSYPT